MNKIKILLITIFLISTVFASQYKRTDILISPWKFEIGDNPKWADPDYDDGNWEEIKVPSNWEEQGFPGYDGYAWYRVRFKIKEPNKNTTYFVRVGIIDDCDMTYINGHMVGFNGSFPPNYTTAYQNQRHYMIPGEYLNPDGPNLLAVRVYDDIGNGGIVWGDIGVYELVPEIKPIVALSGQWKFKKGDDMSWKEPEYSDKNWDHIFVPGIWQFQGYPDYFGFAWYRREFELDPEWQQENLILMLGKIDDLDETYLNGKLLGKTGEINENAENIIVYDWEYRTLRAYYIPKYMLNYNGKNTIAVRVYDGRTYGGIYEGPVGIVTRNQYLELKDDKSFKDYYNFRDLLKDIFGN